MRCAPPTLRAVLSMLGFPGGDARERRDSLARLQARMGEATPPSLVTARLGEPLDLAPFARRARSAKLSFEDGSRQELGLGEGPEGRRRLPGSIGPDTIAWKSATGADARRRAVALHHDRGCRAWRAHLSGSRRRSMVCGARATAGQAIWAPFRRSRLLPQRTARMRSALSPLHALFSAMPERFGPYSPSSRLFHNPLHADPAMIFGAERVRAAAEEAGLRGEMAKLESLDLVDWPRAARAKLALFRTLFESFERVELESPHPGALAADFKGFVTDGGEHLAGHARFEALHAARLAADRDASNWREWPALGAIPKAPRSRISSKPIPVRSRSMSSCNGSLTARSPLRRAPARAPGCASASSPISPSAWTVRAAMPGAGSATSWSARASAHRRTTTTPTVRIGDSRLSRRTRSSRAVSIPILRPCVPCCGTPAACASTMSWG